VNASQAKPNRLNKSSISDKFIFHEIKNAKKVFITKSTVNDKIKALQTILSTKTTKDTVNYLIAVIRCETGNFSSRAYKENKNLCGMRYPVPKAKRTRDKNYYVVYDNINDSVDDLLRHVRHYKHRSWYHSKRYKKLLKYEIY
jgi:hypothetical protein